YGLDLSRKFYTSKDFELMDAFFEIDLNFRRLFKNSR
ncbi:unnamed protein product, partial [marine sediment metagenome]